MHCDIREMAVYLISHCIAVTLISPCPKRPRTSPSWLRRLDCCLMKWIYMARRRPRSHSLWWTDYATNLMANMLWSQGKNLFSSRQFAHIFFKGSSYKQAPLVLVCMMKLWKICGKKFLKMSRYVKKQNKTKNPSKLENIFPDFGYYFCNLKIICFDRSPILLL